ncbi:MAG: 6-phosphofructokinase [Candidatus Firestonebacteria bacterium]|nr:6-phosphofructokinase [Candidatus Firestonebacteria bacterium]
MNKNKRIGVLTGGGDCPGLNAVIRAIVKRGILEYSMGITGILDGYKGLINNNSIPLKINDVSGILSRGGTILGTSNRDNPFRYLVETDGKKEIKDVSASVLENIKKLDLSALIVIGGDGSLKIAYELYKKGVPVVGVPKTIDNDLSCTDVTFGFDTALITATEAIDKLHTTAESHHRVMIVEVMGRNAGWIALHAGIAGGADVILIPEIPFSIDSICNKIFERQKYGKKFSIIVIAEGAKEKGGQVVVKKIVEDTSEAIRLGGIGNLIGDKLEKKTGIETRVTILGHLQRGGNPSPFDRILATRFGTEAIQMVHEEQFGVMVALQTPDIVSVPLNEAVRETKNVKPEGQIVRTARSIGICFGDP